jgi:hypothetical protein
MKHILALATLMLLPLSSFASNPILEYKYGNQITGSVLTISDDGTVVHTERTCCAPRTDVIPEAKLSEKQLVQLADWIAEAAQGKLKTTQGNPTAMGSSAGTLNTYQDDIIVIIHEITRGNAEGSYDVVRKNSSAAADKIEALVNQYVKDKMY